MVKPIFEELVKELDPTLKAIARRLDGKYTAFDDKDLYQEALVHLWEKFRDNSLSDKTRSFILQGCFFEMKNYIRTKYKSIDRCAVSLDEPINEEGDTLLDVVADERAQADDTVGTVEQWTRGMIIDLTERERSVFTLTLRGATTREIGRELGISHVMVVKIKKKIAVKCRGFRETAAE